MVHLYAFVFIRLRVIFVVSDKTANSEHTSDCDFAMADCELSIAIPQALPASFFSCFSAQKKPKNRKTKR